jgi:hypothetical protein
MEMLGVSQVKARIGLKDNSLAIQTVIGSWWEQLELNDLGQLDKGRYLEINMALHHLVQPGISEEEAFETANMDFEEDTKRLRAEKGLEKGKLFMMDFESFYASMFELCDTWVNTTDELDYIDFIAQMQTGHMEYLARENRSLSRAGIKYKTLWKRSVAHISIGLHWAKVAREGQQHNATKEYNVPSQIPRIAIAKTDEKEGHDESMEPSLKRRSDGEAQAALLKLLANASSTAEEQQELLAVLGKLDDGAKAHLIHALSNCGSAEQRKEMLAVLGKMDSEAQAVLLKLLASGSEE